LLLESSFDVPASPEQAWDLLMDVPRVIPCMPGTTFTETVGDSAWKARLEIKLGPVSLAFATDVEREEADREAMRAILTATAREVRGRGGGRARIESTLTPSGGGTRAGRGPELSCVPQTVAGRMPALPGELRTGAGPPSGEPGGASVPALPSRPPGSAAFQAACTL